MTTYSLYGYWSDTLERFANTFDGHTARAAERAAQEYARDEGLAPLRVCGLVEGVVPNVALHTLFVNPNDERNLGAEGIVLDMPGLEAIEYSVLGLAFDPENKRWNETTHGRRRLLHVTAISPAAAEDVARDLVAERHGDLWVCAVLEGPWHRADRYAEFGNPDCRPAYAT